MNGWPEAASPTGVTDEMITAGLRAWFGEDGPFFSVMKSQQRDYMRQALVAALSASTASPAGGQLGPGLPSNPALTASPQGEWVPEGWALVPIEPTEEMLQWGFCTTSLTPKQQRLSYAALLAATPASPDEVKPWAIPAYPVLTHDHKI